MALPTPVDQKPAMTPPSKKEQGCFQCSRRRVVCDKGEPACVKCIKKGIECSGLGRIRFAEGVARRGRFKDCKYPAIRNDADGAVVLACGGPQTLTWPEDRRSAKRKRRNEVKDAEPWKQDVAVVSHRPLPQEELPKEGETGPAVGAGADAGAEAVTGTLAVQPGSGADTAKEDHNPNKDRENDVEEVVRYDVGLGLCHSRTTIHTWLAPADPTERMLFSYFGENVAPAMVFLDDTSNGYRSLVLPMALQDDTLRRAVSVVAAQHLSLKRPQLKPVAEAWRTAIISRLYKNSLAGADQVFNQFTWMTLIVLLVGETVTGNTDFGFLTQMLLSLSANSKLGDMESDVNRFLQAQTDLFEFLGVPLLGEEIGVLTIMRASELMTRIFWYPHLPKDSEDYIMANLVTQCFSLACEIYTRCATDRAHDPTIELIQKNAVDQLVGIMRQIPTSFRGAHALVWVCFLAGAQTTDEAQRAFFIDRMRKVHERTKFRNILISIKSLERIWSRQSNERWTLCLPTLSNVLVM